MRCGGMTDVFQWWEAGREAVHFVLSRKFGPSAGDKNRKVRGRRIARGLIWKGSGERAGLYDSFGDYSIDCGFLATIRNNRGGRIEFKFVEEKAAELGL